MTDLDGPDAGPVLYAEPGATGWPVLWGPVFALAGIGIEAATPGPKHVASWLVVGALLAIATAVWVYGRRKVCAVTVTPSVLRQGREEVEIARMAAVTEVGAPVGARVLGGGWTSPKGTTEVPVRLRDGEVVLAWARDPDALAETLAELVEQGS